VTKEICIADLKEEIKQKLTNLEVIVFMVGQGKEIFEEKGKIINIIPWEDLTLENHDEPLSFGGMSKGIYQIREIHSKKLLYGNTKIEQDYRTLFAPSTDKIETGIFYLED